MALSTRIEHISCFDGVGVGSGWVRRNKGIKVEDTRLEKISFYF